MHYSVMKIQVTSAEKQGMWWIVYNYGVNIPSFLPSSWRSSRAPPIPKKLATFNHPNVAAG